MVGIRNWMILGAAVPRIYFAVVYFYFATQSIDAATRTELGRTGVFIWLFVEILYALLRMIAKREHNELGP